jgi:LysM repeat protein
MIRAFALPVLAFVVLAMAASSSRIATADNTYSVQDGDTLLALASKLGIPSNQMLGWVASTVTLNGLDDADSIKPGQVLKLPSSVSESGTPAQAAPKVEPASKAPSAGSYTVVDGDTLLGIAAKSGIAADQRLAWVAKVLTLNGLSSPDQLAVGQALRLPVESTPVKVDSISAASTANPSTSASPATTSGGAIKGYASSYNDSFTNKPMGCIGAGRYTPTDITIVAVGPAMYDQFHCGSAIEVCGPKGCLTGVRKDSCPGCQSYHVDLSRAGLTAVCGPNACDVRIRRLP